MKLHSVLGAVLLSASLVLPAQALTLEVDGADRTAETRAVAVEGHTYVSLRAASALLRPEAEIAWAEGVASVTAGDLILTARPGEAVMRCNGAEIPLAAGVLAEDGVVLVPLRPLAEVLGVPVLWDGAAQTVRLSTAGEALSEPVPAGYSQEDLYWLARIISAESQGESQEGKLAVGTVVLNRVQSPDFPDTIYDVIFDPRWGGQFEPARNGTIYQAPTEESLEAARLCLQGARAAGDSLYFLAPSLTDNHWTMENCTYVTTIGCHCFYR